MKKAFILAGGVGRRLRPYTFVIPKPIMPICEKPIISIVLDRLIKDGFKDITISLGYMGELLVSVVNNLKLEANISFVSENTPLGTAGSINLMKDFDDDILVMNGDLLTSLNFNEMLNFHKKNNAIATIGLFRREVKIDFGVIKVDENNNFKDYIEKPTEYFDVSMGINILSPLIKQYLKNEYLDMPDLIKKIHANEGKVACYKEECKWLDIGREYDYDLATKEFELNKEEYL